MRAQVFYEPEKMKLEDISIPKISDMEVLIKVKVCGICGSDMAYYYGKSPVETKTGKGPLVLGHEFAGEVVEVGRIPKELNLFKSGDRVVAEPRQPCYACKMCLKGNFNHCENSKVSGVSVNGAFAEYTKTNYSSLMKLPDEISFEEAALLEPLTCSTYAIGNSDINIGDFVIVIGPGTIGLMMTQLAKAHGAGKVALIGILDYSLEIGKSLGADYIFNTHNKNSPYYISDIFKEIKKLTDSYMADRVMVATPAVDAAHLALQISGKKSTIVFFGLGGPKDMLQIPLLESLISEKRMIFSLLGPLSWSYSIKAASTGKVILSNLITHRFRLEELDKALKFMTYSTEDKIKGIVFFDHIK